MTVILGVRTDKTVIVAGDKRVTNILNNQMVDDSTKIMQINKSLCIAMAGNNAISAAIKMEIEKNVNKSDVFIEDLIKIIDNFYKRLSENNLTTIMAYQAAFIIGGLKNNGATGLYAIYNNQGQLKIVEICDLGKIIPPDGMSEDDANFILASNLNKDGSSFVEKTIRDISEINKYVSPTGDKWVYNKQSNNSKKFSFDEEDYQKFIVSSTYRYLKLFQMQTYPLPGYIREQ